MRLLVTGAFGFIGSHFSEMAIKNGHEVVGIDSLAYSGRSKNIGMYPIEVLHTDICDSEFVGRIISEYRPDSVVHFAAETHVSRSIDSRSEFIRTNVEGTNTLLEQCLKYWRGDRSPGNPRHDETCNFLFLHVSTDEVYGSLGEYDDPWTEESPYNPNNPYSASKAAADHFVRAYHHTYGLPTIITHSANNYGSRQHPEKFIPTIIKQCMNGQPMTLHGDGLQIRDWLHVEDHCEGILAAITRGRPGRIYNFPGSCERTNISIARLIESRTSSKAGAVFVPDRAGNDRRYAMHYGRSYREIGWKPKCNIELRINEVIQWYLDNPNYGDEYGR